MIIKYKIENEKEKQSKEIKGTRKNRNRGRSD
jgi:hypothetical protein